MILNLQSLVKRGSLFFFFMSLFSAFFYGVGVRQDFMDSTQIMLLRISALLGLILGMLAMSGMALNIWSLIRGGDPRFFPGITAYLAAVLFGILTAAAAILILVLAGGNLG
jgi:hypothetical protein